MMMKSSSVYVRMSSPFSPQVILLATDFASEFRLLINRYQ